MFSTSIAFTEKLQGGALLGPGALSCGKFLTESKEFSIEAQYLQWALGFISGVNYGKEKNIGIETDRFAVMKQLENYCREHPLDAFGEAVIDLYQKLSEWAK
jgi:hypothetical protein